MRVFLIGGTGFVGPALVEQLLQRGHEVTLLHRGQTHDVRTTDAIGDRNDVTKLSEAIESAVPNVVVDMIPFTARDAETVQQACNDSVERVVALSSIDVYLAYGRIKKTELGPPQLTPMTEESELRQTDEPEGPESDKISVERSYLGNASLPATILRLPAFYGARDKYRRLRDYLKRMDDGRDSILLGDSIAPWKFSRGYVDNVAHAIVLAVENASVAGEIYNVAEPQAMTELEFVQAIGRAAEWQGDVKVIPDSQLPEYLQPKADFSQDWDVDSSKIRSQIGYSEIVEIDDAIRRSIQWERDNPPDVEPFEIDYEQEDRAIQARRASE